MNKEKRLDNTLSVVELRENAMQVTHIGQQILNNSIQERRDSKTIVLKRKQS